MDVAVAAGGRWPAARRPAGGRMRLGLGWNRRIAGKAFPAIQLFLRPKLAKIAIRFLRTAGKVYKMTIFYPAIRLLVPRVSGRGRGCIRRDETDGRERFGMHRRGWRAFLDLWRESASFCLDRSITYVVSLQVPTYSYVFITPA